MSFLLDQIKNQKILEMEVSLDDFLKENNISEKAMIHTVMFDKSVFSEETEVREYLKNILYSWEPSITENEGMFLAVVQNPSQMDLDTEVEVELRRGVTVKAADMMPVMSFEEVQFNEKGEVNLSSKFQTINLSEGLPHIIEIARVSEGEHAQYGKISITEENLESMEINFKSKVTGVDLSINEDHKKNEAFGWFKDVFRSYDNQVLYAQVVWNSKGTTALSEKEYRYFSPEFRFNYKHPHSGKEHGCTLVGGALTNYPFLKMDAIVELNNKQEQKENVVSKETTIDLSVHNEKVVELNNKLSTVQSELDAKNAENIELSDKVKALEEEKAKKAREDAHQKLFDDKKINAAQLVALNEGKSHLEVLALGENMNTNPKGGSSNNSNDKIELSEKEKALAEKFGLTEEEFLAANKGA